MPDAVTAAVVGAVAKEAIDVAADPFLKELQSSVKKQLHYLLHIEGEIRFLRNLLPKLKEAIWSAEVKLETAEMRRALRGFVEDAEDILDEFDARTAQRRRQNQVANPQGKRIKMPSLKVHNLTPSRWKFGNKMKALNDELEKSKSDDEKVRKFMADVEKSLCLAKKEGEGAADDRLPRRSITGELLRRDFQFVGRIEMKKKVMEELLQKDMVPSVVLITGMAGVGKTTLAQDIFRQREIMEGFEFRSWVSVGDELDPERVMGKILCGEKASLDEILSKLKEKRFLIVLDDCWSGKLTRWNQLWTPLTFGSNGSKVLITSRVDISKELSPTCVKTYPLGGLTDDECLQIFETYAFPGGVPSTSSGNGSTSRLREIGREIVEKKIKGLPLAAKVLGASLATETQESFWNDVLVGGFDDGGIMSVLMWSYRRLPWYLKQCFAYLSIFSKNRSFAKEAIVLIWMAHGYVQPSGILTLECIGERYFDFLVKACLIQKQKWGHVIYYNMHDVIHDLAVYVSRNAMIENDAPSNHLSIYKYGNLSEISPDKIKQNLQRLFRIPTATCQSPFITTCSSSYSVKFRSNDTP